MTGPPGGGPERGGAAIFDVDGTLVDSERHGHRVAFNRAFEELGLPYVWDEDLYGELLHVTGGQRRIDGYLAGQGVAEAERNQLGPKLHARKTEILQQMVDEGAVEVRPGVTRLLDELGAAGDWRLAVGTTGSRGWVDRLLRRLLPATTWDVVVTGDDVTARKPDPEVFDVARRQLGLPGPEQAVVIEDSGEGLAAARAAGMRCVVVVNGYTADHDLAGADLVLDGFGMPGAPAAVLADSHGTGCEGILTADVLRILTQCPG
ncbi:MAG TPA: HAD-IA family hydrolase [Acidimicrobiales bacterium]|nr:HAD-IA family hydrolase [Acidimicrobiales bacterium]